MSQGKKFLLIMSMLLTGGCFFGIVLYTDHYRSFAGIEWLLALLVVMLVVNALIYRRLVATNPWLGPETRVKMRAVVTRFGPLGQMACYVSHIHPYDEDTPKPVAPILICRAQTGIRFWAFDCKL